MSANIAVEPAEVGLPPVVLLRELDDTPKRRVVSSVVKPNDERFATKTEAVQPMTQRRPDMPLWPRLKAQLADGQERQHVNTVRRQVLVEAMDLTVRDRHGTGGSEAEQAVTRNGVGKIASNQYDYERKS